MFNQSIIIIGAGPAGLMAAQKLAEKGFKVNVYEQNKAAARKFLVAGHGGFNLTHHEKLTDFIQRYDKEFLHPIIRNFDNIDTIKWLKDLGIETYVGSSGKIFPIKNIKPIQVLQAWLNKLEILGVNIHYNHKFTDFDSNKAIFEHHSCKKTVPFDKLIFCLGGASWSKTGSDGKWENIFKQKGIKITKLESANSGYNTKDNFIQIEGEILKNIEVRFNSIRRKGELVFTNYGIEGSPIYYLNRFTRKSNFPSTIHIDLKPSLSEEKIQSILKKGTSVTNNLKEHLKLNTTALYLLKKIPKETYIDKKKLAHLIKNYPIEITNLRPIDEVISTAGGISVKELKNSLALKKYPNIFCLGEMLDWEAPTGGYLLQACFSMGVWAAQHIN